MQNSKLTIISILFSFVLVFSFHLDGKEIELLKIKPDAKGAGRVAPLISEQVPTGDVPMGVISDRPASVPLNERHLPLGTTFRIWEKTYRNSRLESDIPNILTEKAPPVEITDKAKLAIDTAPIWIKEDLEFAFPRLGSKQDSYADLILNASDLRYIDELAFMIAHTSDVEINRMSTPDIFSENVKWIYENVELLDFVEIVDVGTPLVDRDFYTTTKYIYKEGREEKEYLLPIEEYYWYIVHPKLNNESIRMDEEPSAQQATYGYWWREFIMRNPSEIYDYKAHKVTQEPNYYGIEHFNTLTNHATGHITGWMNYPVMPIIDSITKQPVFIEQKDYNGAFTGCMMVTTLPVEKMYEDGESEFLENILKRGYFNTPLPWLPVPGIKIVIFKDVDPFGTPTNENILRDLNYNVKVYGSESFGDSSILVKKPQPVKVIIASGQPREFYEKLSEHKDWFVDWIQKENVLEFHAAIDPEIADWVGLEFSLGVSFDDPYENQVTDFEFGYYPVLQDIVAPAAYLWEGDSFSHTTPWMDWYGSIFDISDFAIQAQGKWIAQIMQALVSSSDLDRAVQPNQIAMLKIGMCGEMQDITMAAFRSSLVPIEAVNDYSEDHVWTELFFLDDWTFFEVWRGGMVSAMGKPAGVYDSEYGGKYDISGTWQWRGDGYTINVTDRYTPTCTIDAKVVDNNGNPVDGARFEVWSNYVWGNYMYSVWGYTNENGYCSIKVGDNRNYWGKIITEDAGTYPHQSGNIETITTTTAKDTVYKWENPVIDTEIPQLKVNELPIPDDPTGSYKFQIDYSVIYQILNAPNPEDLNVFTEKIRDGIIDFFICDEDNFSLYRNGFRFNAYTVNLRSRSNTINFQTPDDNNYYIVFSNESKMVLKEAVDADITVLYKASENPDSWETAESLQKTCILPAGDRWYFKLGENKAPKITMAGFGNSEITESEGGDLEIHANILNDVDKLMVYLNGKPSGLEFEATEGENSFNIPIPAGIPAGSYQLELKAKTTDVTESALWPYLNVGDTPSKTSYIENRVENILQSETLNPDAPVILMFGFGNSEITTSGGGNLEIYAKVDDPQGVDDIDRVEVYIKGSKNPATTLSHQGDGLYYFVTGIPRNSGIPAGSYIFELAAEDRDGNRSSRAPYLTIYE